MPEIRVVNGMHVSNTRHWHIEQMLQAAKATGAVTILHHLMFERDELADQWGDVENNYWFVKLRDGWEPQGIPPAPERLIHVRMYHPNWCALDAVTWAEHTVEMLSNVKCPLPDGGEREYNLWQDPFVAVSAANEQNLHYECGDPNSGSQPQYQTKEHYERIARWNLDFWRRIDQLVPDRRALSCWSALAQGHDPDGGDVPDGEYQIPAIREAIEYCDLLASHPYAHLDWPDGEKTAPGGTDRYWHMLRDFRPEGWRETVQPGRPPDPGGILAQFPGKTMLVTEAGTFSHSDKDMTEKTLGAMRALLDTAAKSGRIVGVTFFIWSTDEAHPENNIWLNEDLREKLATLEEYTTIAKIPQARAEEPPPEETERDRAFRAWLDRSQVISPFPEAALETAIRADGYELLSNEDRVTTPDDVRYAVQGAYKSGEPKEEERIYFAEEGDWNNVQWIWRYPRA